MATRILLAEDDENLGLLLTQYLQAKEYKADLYRDGEEAWEGFQRKNYEICVLDVMMPLKDGFTLARQIREINNSVPILFLTAKSMKEDVFEGFEIGADDYLTKPFEMEELTYRIDAILRRSKAEPARDRKTFKLGKYTFDADSQKLVSPEGEKKLTTKESGLLHLLCLNKNDVLDRNEALKNIWYDDSYFNARSMDVYITKLRKYLRDDARVQIMNIHGKGYKMLVQE